MANTVYSNFLVALVNGTFDHDSDVVRVMLERGDSSYVPHRDHAFVRDLAGFVECSLPNYARQTVELTCVSDDKIDSVKIGFAEANFGMLEAGEVIKGFVVYRQQGLLYPDPVDDLLIAYFDAGKRLPIVATGYHSITVDGEGFLQLVGERPRRRFWDWLSLPRWFSSKKDPA
jgi:hypothetical protein